MGHSLARKMKIVVVALCAALLGFNLNLGADGVEFSRTASASPLGEQFKDVCPEAFQYAECQNYLAVHPLPAAVCSAVCVASGSTITGGKCTIVAADTNTSPPTPAKDKISLNGCVVSDKVWWHGGGSGGPVCKDSDVDGVPDEWNAACDRDPKYAEAKKQKGNSKGDNCRLVANGSQQTAVVGIGDQLDLTDANGKDKEHGGGPDGIGDACQFSTSTMAAEIAARVDALEAALGVVGDDKAKAAALADLARIKAEGGFASRKDIDRITTMTNTVNHCLADGQVPVLATDGSPTGACAENPDITKVKANQAAIDVRVTDLEQTPATGELGLYAGGTVGDDSFGIVAPEVELVVRPSPHVNIYGAAAIGWALGKSEANIATSLAVGVDAANALYHGESCTIGLGIGGRYTTALDDSFDPLATALGAEVGLPIVCGHASVRISGGAARAATENGHGILPTVGGKFSYRF